MATNRQASAGEMRGRVTFQRRTKTSGDGAGNFEGPFTDFFARDARISPLVGGEEFTAARLQGISHASIRVRSDTLTRTVDNSWRAIDKRSNPQVAWDILAVMNMDEKNIWLEFTCSSGKPG